MNIRPLTSALLAVLIVAVLCQDISAQSSSRTKAGSSTTSAQNAQKKPTQKKSTKKKTGQKKSAKTPAQKKPAQQQPAAKAATPPPPQERGGRSITSTGELNVLFVYVQFPDDRYLPDSPNWPKGKPPVYMKGTVDETWSPSATKGSFTDYFNQMSFNKLKITGTCVSAVTPHTRAWYLHNNKKRGEITQETIEELDKTIDFAPYDHWKYLSDYHQQNTSDGNVDMVLMLWRNVCNDTADVRNALDLVPGGEASLGYGANYTVDNGARTIRTGYGGSGSGVTAIHPLGGGDLGQNIIWLYARHEFGHWLLGGNEYHTDLGTWGLTNGWGTPPGGVMNSFERAKVGWITPTTIDDISTPRVLRNVPLADFATTGAAYRIKVPGGGPDEYYLLENHQRISQYDIPDYNVPTATGLYVLLQKSAVGSAVGIVSAEGRFKWTVPQQLPNIYGAGELPVFLRGSSDRVDGYSKRQYIPWEWKNAKQTPAAIHYYMDTPGGPVHKAPPTIFTGNGKDQFDMNNARVFSPESNPSSDIHHDKNKVGFELTGINNGVVTLNIYINTTDESSPSKPQDVAARVTGGRTVTVTWSPNLEADVASGGGYNVFRELLQGPRIVAPSSKRNSSLLARPTFTEAVDLSNVPGASAGSDIVARYRVEAVDRTHKASVQSEGADCRLSTTSK